MQPLIELCLRQTLDCIAAVTAQIEQATAEYDAYIRDNPLRIQLPGFPSRFNGHESRMRDLNQKLRDLQNQEWELVQKLGEPNWNVDHELRLSLGMDDLIEARKRYYWQFRPWVNLSDLKKR